MDRVPSRCQAVADQLISDGFDNVQVKQGGMLISARIPAHITNDAATGMIGEPRGLKKIETDEEDGVRVLFVYMS